jgi:hypothetical protein
MLGPASPLGSNPAVQYLQTVSGGFVALLADEVGCCPAPHIYVIDIGRRRITRLPGGPLPLTQAAGMRGAIAAGFLGFNTVSWPGRDLWIVACDTTSFQAAYWPAAHSAPPAWRGFQLRRRRPADGARVNPRPADAGVRAHRRRPAYAMRLAWISPASIAACSSPSLMPARSGKK